MKKEEQVKNEDELELQEDTVKEDTAKSATPIGKLIDADILDAKEQLKSRTYGELSNILNAFKMKYQEVETVKNGLLFAIKTEKAPKEREKINGSLRNLYIALQKIEERCSLIEILRAEKRPKN